MEKAFVCPQGAYDPVTKRAGVLIVAHMTILLRDPAMESVGVGGFSQDMYIAKR